VWALDMNWRNTSSNQDHYYNHPNTNLFPNFTEWFSFLRAHKLRTCTSTRRLDLGTRGSNADRLLVSSPLAFADFNDHPFPVASRGAGGLQTSPEEIAFRWNGLSEWMARGLTYW
jgi:hypothetical protein